MSMADEPTEAAPEFFREVSPDEFVRAYEAARKAVLTKRGLTPGAASARYEALLVSESLLDNFK